MNSIPIGTIVFCTIFSILIIYIIYLLRLGEQRNASMTEDQEAYQKQLELYLKHYEEFVWQYQKELATLHQRNERLYNALLDSHSRFARNQSELSNVIQDLDQYCDQRQRNYWLNQLRQRPLSTKLEVEHLLIMPLLLHLGYELDDIAIQEPIQIPVPGNPINEYIDWSIYKRNIHGVLQRLFIIQVMEPDRSIDDEAAPAIDTLAFRAGVDKYIITNGSTLYIHHRRSANNSETLGFRREDMQGDWERIFDELNSTAFPDIAE